MSELKFVLEHGETAEGKVRVLIFAGQYDLICNHVGLEKSLQVFNWSKADKWRTSVPVMFNSKSNGEMKNFGYYQEVDNLSYLRIKESGHMVPLDQPEVALDMIRRFIKRESFGSDLAPARLFELPTDANFASKYGIQLQDSRRGPGLRRHHLMKPKHIS